jgi:exopolysaccharide biosynthesis polyprenyl glycosylphosphotransferase
LLVIGIGDLAVLGAVLTIGLAQRASLAAAGATLQPRLLWYATLALVWLGVSSALRVYDLQKAYSLAHSLKSAMGAAAVASVLYLCIPFFTPTLPTRRLQAAYFVFLAATGVGLWRLFFIKVFAHPGFQRRALVIGAGWAGSVLAALVQRTGPAPGNPYLGTGYDLLGFIDDDPEKQRQTVAGLPVLGTHRDLVGLVKELQAAELILAITRSGDLHGAMFQAILDCRALGVGVTRMQTVYERLTGQVPVEHAGRNLEVVLPLGESTGRALYVAFRRGFDLVLSIPGCLLLAWLSPWVWLANRISSPGPLFYRQERVGKSGRVFELIKFRSMRVGAEAETGEAWADEADPRITPVGRFLRKTRLDELPQVWTVLKGDMALIGPRPERPFFVERLATAVPFYRMRHAIQPGITGWAQVQYGYGASEEDAFIKLRYDFFYIKNQGPLLDLAILYRTVGIVLGLKGR